MTAYINAVCVAAIFVCVAHDPGEAAAASSICAGCGVLGREPVAGHDGQNAFLGKPVAERPVKIPISGSPRAAV